MSNLAELLKRAIVRENRDPGDTLEPRRLEFVCNEPVNFVSAKVGKLTGQSASAATAV
jgi:hypothetical protein